MFDFDGKPPAKGRYILNETTGQVMPHAGGQGRQ
jgi:hypothetical protein